MKREFQYFIASAIVMSSLLIGCSKDDDNSTPAEAAKPSIAEKTSLVTVPASLKNSTSTAAQTCASYLESVNSITSMTSIFTIPDGATESKKKSDGTHNYTWSNGQQTVYYTWVEGTLKNSWTIYYSDPNYNVTKAKIYYAEELVSGLEGKFEYYNWYGDGSLLGTWDWVIVPNKTTTVNYKVTSQGYNFVYKVIANADGSGSFIITMSGTVYYQGQWNSEGHGSITSSSGTETF